MGEHHDRRITRPRYGSLFTGAGGLDLAVHMLWPDAELAWWSEVDEHAAASFARHTDAPNLGDITQVDWSDVEPVDVLVGGFPCQDLSHAGKRAGINADRSGLWFHMLAAANALEPRWLLAENVPGIYTATGDDDELELDRDVLDGRAARPARALDTVLGSLADDGLDAVWGDYRASDVGACHQRRRWFCVAWDPASERVEGLGSGRVQEPHAHAGPPVPVRSGQDAGLTLPTPTSSDANGPGAHGDGGPDLRTVVSLLPTPRSTDGPKGGPGQVNGRGVPDSLPAIGALLPTPTSQAAKHGATPDVTAHGYGSNLWDIPHLLPTPSAADGTGGHKRRGGDRGDELLLGGIAEAYAERWGEYAPAIARWEHVTGIAAPAPTDDKGRLSAPFVEWMMGWPDGWTAGSRSQRLKQCGNGVVPLQAAHAYAQLLDRAAQAQEEAA